MLNKRNDRTLKPNVPHKVPPIINAKTPAISEIETPVGYRAVSISHAMMEYAKPVMEFVESGIVKDMNKALQIATDIWNYAIEMEQTNIRIYHEGILKAISTTLKMNGKESKEFFDFMIQRKKNLLYPDCHFGDSRTMFIKNDDHFLITEFDYNSLVISEELLLVDSEDKKFVEMLNRMDKYIQKDTDYEKWENFFFKLENTCKFRFEEWLFEKGVEKFKDEFVFYVEVFLNYTYRYGHDDNITLKSMTLECLEEFFYDHILRKVMLEPNEYVQLPPAIKVFYRFLSEKEYLKNSDAIERMIDEIEPKLLKILRKRFS